MMRCLFIFLNAIGITGGLKAQAPVITSFSPASAIPGASVTLTGTGFNSATTNNIVFFGATMATVTAASATSITATVPTGATYAPITLLNTGTVLACASLSNFNPIYSPAKANFVSGDLSAKVDFTPGSNPHGVAIGDLDGDGKPDLAVANASSASVSVFRNTSSSGSIASGSFATKVDFTPGSNPLSVAIGDLDGDGKPELAVANYNSATVSVFRNTSSSGTVTFNTKVDFTTGSGPFSVAIGDLDGDGKADLAVANFGATTVSVLRNTSSSGTVSFGTKVDFTAETNPVSMAIGDLDGDGKPDLAVANFGSARVSVFRNTSSSGSITTSSFATKVNFTTGTSPRSVVIGDLDGDGKADLAVANAGSASVSVFHNTSSSGSIASGSFADKVDFTTTPNATSVAIGDLDGDGKPDLVATIDGSPSVSVFRNTSSSGSIASGSFAIKVDFTTGTNPLSLAIGDLDGDGRPDLAVANYSASTLSVFRNAGATWNGSVSTDWSTAANWTPNAVPAVGQLVVIPTGLTNYPAVPSDRTISSLSLASGSSLNLNSNTLTLTSGLSNAGSITGAGKLTMGGSSAQSISGTGTVSNLEVNNSTGVTITSGAGNMQSITGVLTPTAGTLTTNGNLTLKSSAAGTARVAAVPVSGAAITGNVTVERHIPAGRKWRMLTAPVKGSSNTSVFYNWQNNGSTSGNNGVDIWGPGGSSDPAAGNGLQTGPNPSMRSYSAGWQNMTDTKNSALFDANTNNAYAVFVSGPFKNGSVVVSTTTAAVATTLSATGNLITGTHTKTLSASPAAGQFFLVGNPYAAPVYIKDISGNNLTGTFYMWDAAEAGTNQLGKYVGYERSTGLYSTPTTGFPDSSTRLQSGQAFFVKADQASVNTSITFEESHKALNSSNGMFGNGGLTDYGMLRTTLQHENNGKVYAADGAVAIFYADGNPAIDKLDGTKLMNSGENLFMRRSNVSLMFEHRPEILSTDTVYLRMNNLLQQSYRLQLEAKDLGVQEAWLLDAYAKKEMPLLMNGRTDYDFTVTADSLSTGDRFLVVFSKAAAPVVVTTDTDGGEALRLYPNPVREKLKVSVNTSASGSMMIQVFDASGSEVWRRTGIAAGTKTVEVNTAGLRNGVYTLALTDAEGRVRVEKFVRE